LGQTIAAERVVLYCRALADIQEPQLLFAFEQALRHLGEFLPSVQALRGFAESWRPPESAMDCRHILDRGDKPPDWEPLKPGELEEMRAAKKRVEIVKTKIEESVQQHEMPKLSAEEFEERRRRQLEAFRRKNVDAGEV